MFLLSKKQFLKDGSYDYIFVESVSAEWNMIVYVHLKVFLLM